MMSKKNYIFLFLFAFAVFSINIIFQKTPGFMDSEYYFLGGKYLAKGDLSAPVLWNYLDNPKSLPHSLFTYWMPFPSILSMIPMVILNNYSFLTGRFLFLVIAALIPLLTMYMGFLILKNKFASWIAALLSIFGGFYYKFYTITETVTIYIFLGGLYFLLIHKLFKSDKYKNVLVISAILGLVTGFLHLTRVDGIFFVGLSIIAILFEINLSNRFLVKKIPLSIFAIGIFLVSYLLISGWWYLRNLELFSMLFSPANSKAIWIASYEDTFTFPASNLNFSFWLQSGFPQKGHQIWQSLKNNMGNIIAVQSYIIGFPLLILSLLKHWKKNIFIFPILYFLIIFTIMTIIFSEAGGRGGFLHSIAAIQIFFWILIADGLNKFIQWGIQVRGWSLHRSQLMFGSALIGFSILLTTFVYLRDVIGFDRNQIAWNQEFHEFIDLEEQIDLRSDNKMDVLMINDPVGYHVATGRWSIVIPKSDWQELEILIDEFDVKYIILDNNLPDGLSNIDLWIKTVGLEEITRLASGKILYEVK